MTKNTLTKEYIDRLQKQIIKTVESINRDPNHSNKHQHGYLSGLKAAENIFLETIGEFTET